MSKALKTAATHASVCIVISSFIVAMARLLKSDYLTKFFESNLILLLVALLAINTTTISVIMTKLRELSNDPGVFGRTRSELRVSIIEQLCLIALSALVLIGSKSQPISANIPHAAFVSDVLLLAIFCYAVYILYDTAESVFVIIGFEETTGKDQDA